MTSASRLKTLCPHLYQLCWIGEPSSLISKQCLPLPPHSLFEPVSQETEAPSCLSLRRCRPFCRVQAGLQIALRGINSRLKTQDA